MTRFDLFTTVHKAIRRELFEAVEAVGRTDFGNAAETAATAESLRFLMRLLAEHAEHEEDWTFGVLERHSPELARELTSDHAKLDGAQEEILRLLERLPAADASLRQSLGRRVHERMLLLVADQLRHTLREETEVNRVLWAHLTDEELIAINDSILATIPASRMAEWMERILPAANLPERVQMMSEMKRALPAEAFEQVLGPARTALGPKAWQVALALAV
jgi:hypothetical protein